MASAVEGLPRGSGFLSERPSLPATPSGKLAFLRPRRAVSESLETVQSECDAAADSARLFAPLVAVVLTLKLG
jgi:hypothetical protein